MEKELTENYQKASTVTFNFQSERGFEQLEEIIMSFDLKNITSGTDPELIEACRALADWQRPNAYDNADFIYNLMTDGATPYYFKTYNPFIIKHIKNEFAPNTELSKKLDKYRNLYQSICDEYNHQTNFNLLGTLFESFYGYLYEAVMLTYEAAFRNKEIDYFNKNYQSSLTELCYSIKLHEEFLSSHRTLMNLATLLDIVNAFREIIKVFTKKATEYGIYFRAYDKGVLIQNS